MFVIRLVFIALINTFSINGFSTISRLVKAVSTGSEDSIFQDSSNLGVAPPSRLSGLVPYRPITTAGFLLGDYIKQFLTTTVAPRTEQAHPYRNFCRLKDTNRRYNIFCRYKDNPADDAVDFCNFYQVACLIYRGSSGGGGGSSSIFENGDFDDGFDFNGNNENGNNERGKKKYPIGMSDIFKKDQKPVPVQFGVALKVD